MISVFRLAIAVLVLEYAYHTGLKDGMEYSHPDALTAADMIPPPRTSSIDYFPPSEGDSP